MCKKTNYKTPNPRIDKCMVECISTLNAMSNDTNIKITACCCGHGKYPMTIVIKNKAGYAWELFSGVEVPRSRRFYKRDKQGYYYIPEVVEHYKNMHKNETFIY